MGRFSARRYLPGDAEQINALYKRVTRRDRSIEQYRWQWLDAPGGAGEIWVIEDSEAESDARIIGHHGLMPMFFSRGAEIFLFGKTENTMVDPELRKKLLYPIYEKRFLAQYESRFDATFSTTGPAAALRQRTAFGYDATQKWVHYDWPLRAGAVIGHTAAIVQKSKRAGIWKAAATGLGLAAKTAAIFPSGRRFGGGVDIRSLSNEEAKTEALFDDFWREARTDQGLTPRREKVDLNWRFWSNPNGERETLFARSGAGIEAGYAILRKRNPHRYELEDIVTMPNTPEAFTRMFKGVLAYASDAGCASLGFSTTDDPASPSTWIRQMSLGDIKEHFPYSRRNIETTSMLRRISPQSALHAFNDRLDWNVTPFVFEGAH